jgi:hypothetical protein
MKDTTEPMRGTGDSLKEAIRAREMYPEVTTGLHCCAIDLKGTHTVLDFARIDGVYSKGKRKGLPKWVPSSRVSLTVTVTP